ncbi:hypothetical protein LZ575_14500 [Antarcticibacterium sp. 1MA-6-2]|uniref:DUF6730 family protein n=1 Tax=Antarcticibacterium sp. 1MA-6-2 TaxID=2908210 RepID=UPI001F2315F8|nr:DUF6730 family protein [Antarcticibacterium sp. 1MA-6-2]UJH90116.1 hypothetical protein LZ575_14500 [Antarcticibacterium sp. 1MA-6-2]
MKKLDEIMELMADEMADFKSSVQELQKLCEQLFNLSIPISTEALEKELNIFLQKQEAEKEKTDEILQGIERKLKHAKLIPNNLLILFGISGILALGLVGYFAYNSHIKQEANFEIYRTILETQNKPHEDYFAQYPEIQEAYCEWLEENKRDL